MVKDVHPADQAVLPQPDHGIDGLAGVGRDRRQFLSAEGVAERTVRAAHQVGSGLAIQCRDGCRLGEHLLHVAQGQLRGAGRTRQRELEQQAQQPQCVSMRYMHFVVSRSGSHYAPNHGRQCHALPVPAPWISSRPCRLHQLGVTPVHAEKLADITPVGPPGGGPGTRTRPGQRALAGAPQRTGGTLGRGLHCRLGGTGAARGRGVRLRCSTRTAAGIATVCLRLPALR